MNEFDLIKKYFRPLTQGHDDLQDDAAVLNVPKNHELVVTSDTLSAGTHFLADEEPKYIAHKSLRVNLSDLAAMGAKPLAYQLCIAFPKKPQEKWVREFTTALKKDQKEFGIFCSGGDTTVIKGPLTISITAFGIVPQGKAVKRSGAKPGDALVITGSVGDALAGLRMLQGKIEARNQKCIAQYRKPTPRTAVAKIVQKYARAAIDISDGLIADAGHICKASGCGAVMELEKIKHSKFLSAEDALTGGDDYELVLAVPQRHLSALLSDLTKKGLRPHVIGRFIKGAPRVAVYGQNGKELRFNKSGWTHF